MCANLRRFHIAAPYQQRDSHMLGTVKDSATIVLQQYPHYSDELIERWLGHKDLYANV